MLAWSLNIPLQNQKPSLWLDSVHPSGKLVVSLMIGWIRQIKKHSPSEVKSLLVVGDSTTAECFASWQADSNVRAIARAIYAKTGVNVWFASVSGSSWTSCGKKTPFVEQANSSGSYTFDVVLNVGGWNQIRHGDLKGSEFQEFHKAASARLDKKVHRFNKTALPKLNAV
jgi:hypothetical protein